MPSCGIITIIIGDIVPIIEITGRDSELVFMVTNHRIGDRFETSIERAGRTIPVIELGSCTFFINITYLQEQIWVPGIDQIGDIPCIGCAIGAITGGSQYKWLACRRRGAAGWRKGIRILRSFFNTIF